MKVALLALVGIARDEEGDDGGEDEGRRAEKQGGRVVVTEGLGKLRAAGLQEGGAEGRGEKVGARGKGQGVRERPGKGARGEEGRKTSANFAGTWPREL